MGKKFGFIRPREYGRGGIPFSPVLSATFTILDSGSTSIDDGIRIVLDTNYPAGTTIFVTFDGLDNADFQAGASTISGVTDSNGDITFADTYIYAASSSQTTKNFTINFRPVFVESTSLLAKSGALTWTGTTVTSSGGTETTVSGNKVHTYTYSGSGGTANDTLVITNSAFAFRSLVVAGGGSGGSGSANINTSGGGGAGGTAIKYGTGPTATYATIVGRGGVWVDQTGNVGIHPGESGNNSQFSGFMQTIGGGGGGSTQFQPGPGQGGGSGGGGGGSSGGVTFSGGTPVADQGNTGGRNFVGSGILAGGGGGGAGAVGADATNSTGGQGGIGATYGISGSDVTYSAGGNGGTNTNYQTGSGTTTFGGGGHYNKSGLEDGGNGIIIVEIPPYPRQISVS